MKKKRKNYFNRRHMFVLFNAKNMEIIVSHQMCKLRGKCLFDRWNAEAD